MFMYMYTQEVHKSIVKNKNSNHGAGGRGERERERERKRETKRNDGWINQKDKIKTSK